MDDGTFVYVIFIDTSPELLWDGLTNPAQTRQYWPGGSIATDWKVGSPIKFSGKSPWTGKVLQANSPIELVFTYSGGAAGNPEEPSRVTIKIDSIDGVQRLTLVQDQFVAYTKLRGTLNDVWPRVFSSLKSLLERGRAFR